MFKKIWKNPRPMVICLCAMTFLCLILTILYCFAEKENALLKSSRSEQFMALAAGEAEEAVNAYQNNRSIAEVYHRICSAAAYLSMAENTEENYKIAADLREAGKILLEAGVLSEQAGDSLSALRRHTADNITTMEKEKTDSIQETYDAPWQNMYPITRTEGLRIAETLTETKNCLTPAAGKSFIYTCRNVYVKMSQHGGIPLEIAVYTPVRKDAAYAEDACAFRSSRFLENALPKTLRGKKIISTDEAETMYRFLYPCVDRYIRVDVRKDTGRIIGLQMLFA